MGKRGWAERTIGDSRRAQSGAWQCACPPGDASRPSRHAFRHKRTGLPESASVARAGNGRSCLRWPRWPTPFSCRGFLPAMSRCDSGSCGPCAFAPGGTCGSRQGPLVPPALRTQPLVATLSALLCCLGQATPRPLPGDHHLGRVPVQTQRGSMSPREDPFSSTD